jgi:hypothetical protein
MEIINSLAYNYYNLTTITAVKSFVVQAPGARAGVSWIWTLEIGIINWLFYQPPH